MNYRLLRGMSRTGKTIFFSIPFIFSLILIPAYLIQILNIYGVLSINTDLVLKNNSAYSIRDVEDFDKNYAILKPTESMEVSADKDGLLVSVQAYPMDNMVKLSRGTKSITVLYPSFVSTEVIDDKSDVTKLKIAYDDSEFEVNAFDTICSIYKTDYGYQLTFPNREGFSISVKEMPEIKETGEGVYEISNRVKYFAPKGSEVLIFDLDNHPAGGYMIDAEGVLLKSLNDYKSVGFNFETLLLSFISMFFLTFVLDYVMQKIGFQFKFYWLNYVGTCLVGVVVIIGHILLF